VADFQVASSDCIARAIECRFGIQNLPDETQQLIDLKRFLLPLCDRHQVLGCLLCSDFRIKEIFQRARQVLFADRLAGLFLGPGGEGAPVCIPPGGLCHRHRQLMVALRDLLDFIDSWNGLGWHLRVDR
jgi:hypothetical protein